MTANSIAAAITLQEKRRAASAASHCDTYENYQSPVGTSDERRSPFLGWLALAVIVGVAAVVAKWVVG